MCPFCLPNLAFIAASAVQAIFESNGNRQTTKLFRAEHPPRANINPVFVLSAVANYGSRI